MVGSGDQRPGQRLTGADPPASRGGGGGQHFAGPDPRLLPLLNLSALGLKMDNLRRFLADSIDRRSPLGSDQLQMVSSEITSAVQDVILNSAALLASSLSFNPALLASSSSSLSLAPPLPFPGVAIVDPSPQIQSNTTSQVPDTSLVDPRSIKIGDDPELPSSEPAAADDVDCDIVEIDTAELMAEHIHFCEICGKGFKRDANLRMHMRAHGDRFKTLEALSKPDRDVQPSDGGESTTGRKIRFSCPYPGCNRNQAHKKFRPLKSMACVKNHFKRSHCPKMYSCHRCNKKSFSVVTDLKSHLKHCGENRWRCSCGTNFSRKDKLFGHIALFEGHMPAIDVGAKETKKKDVILEDDAEEEGAGGEEQDGEDFDPEFFKGLMEDLHGMDQGNWRSH